MLGEAWDPGVSQTGGTSGSPLTLANNWPHLCVFTDPWSIARGSANGSQSSYSSNLFSRWQMQLWESLASQKLKM